MRQSLLFILFLGSLTLAKGQTGGTCDYWFDSDYAARQTVNLQGGSCNMEIDVSGLTDAVHTIHFQTTAGEGVHSPVASHLFVKYPPVVASPTYQPDGNGYYWFDSDYADRKQIALGGGLATLDVNHLTAGVHTIHFQGSGTAHTPTASKLFVIMPTKEDTDDRITGYDYWVNDADMPTSVVLEEPISSLSLVSLLPVETQPFRSCCFHFAIEDGQPVLYAKNDIRLRFYLSRTNYTDIRSQYIDESVKVSVDANGMEQLTRNTTVSTPKPAANAIKWYKLEAEAGDSLLFKIDRAATIQLFSPTGSEVFAASSSEALAWHGIHAEETGTYYVALHDVTATQGTTVSLSYGHIDKYAVLRQDIATVGNGGPSTVTFQGNGFDELQGVDLVLGSTVIASSEIATDDKAVVSVKWNFADAPLGEYKAVFHFADDDIVVEPCVTVEEAVPVRLNSTVNYATLFLVSRGNTYSYKVQNQGNMTAYDRPMQLTVYASDPDLLSWVTVDGVEPSSFTEAETFPGGFVYGRYYELNRTLRPGMAEPIDVKVKTNTTGMIYVDLDGVGGPSEAVNSVDPNDIYGYQDADGDKTLYGLEDLWYTIEFENDPTFATASAHEIHVIDQLNPQLFDLSTFSPTRIRIGDQEVKLSDDDRKQGVVTISMQPRIYALAQVEWTLDQETGIVQWHISSLDPMTVEPTTNPMDGVLPVNTDGNGIGQLSFDIKLKPGLLANTEIPNNATIFFDENEPIETPIWTNVVGVLGDANGDGVVTIADVTAVINNINDSTSGTFIEKAANVNHDKVISIADVTGIINIINK